MQNSSDSSASEYQSFQLLVTLGTREYSVIQVMVLVGLACSQSFQFFYSRVLK